MESAEVKIIIVDNITAFQHPLSNLFAIFIQRERDTVLTVPLVSSCNAGHPITTSLVATSIVVFITGLAGDLRFSSTKGKTYKGKDYRKRDD